MSLAPVLLLAAWLQGAPQPPATQPQQYFRYHRSVMAVQGRGEACSVIDPGIFPNAAPSLKDLRLYQDGREIPYAVTLSEPEQLDSDSARVLNLGMRGASIVFDLEMPSRSYTDVVLDLTGKDYLATASVTGGDSPDTTPTKLGEFTLFDLTSQHLSHTTTLHLQESNLRFLHVVLTASPAPGTVGFTASPQMVQGATVPPSREAQTLYTTAIALRDIQQRGHQTVAKASLPARLPIERVSFLLAPEYKGNFSRDVMLSVHAAHQTEVERISGAILRVHLNQTGREIRQQQLSIPAVLGSNLQESAQLEVAVENGDDAPLPITEVLLEMRQRQLCFDASVAPKPELFYGDAALPTPQYDFARLFSPSAHLIQAQLGPEQRNVGYHARPDTRSAAERHPDLIWIVLMIVVCVLAVVALRSSRALPR
ncbi:DUF3999 family protein [Granulicella sp. dw_53]|uniref:DUF3999 family protein n=1 Tax=Granulicella sp. dw_53 TaxID=2719792 RepID=UPI001BD1F9A3|nr:DUF3999 family protein [Granulicella sp. dw_53]